MRHKTLSRSLPFQSNPAWLDGHHLSEAVRLAEEVVAAADTKTGEAKCVYYRSRITYLYDEQVYNTLSHMGWLTLNFILNSYFFSFI